MDQFTPTEECSYRKRFHLALLIVAIVSILAAGCNRAFYRNQADDQVECLIDCAGKRVDAPMEGFSIDPMPESRMYDPGNPDCPPMPPDDPTSHQLMKCVYGMKGAKQWECYGHTPYVQNPCWQNYLIRNKEGAVVIDRLGAMQLALINSREYQDELENLYLSALEVTYQRFRFDVYFPHIANDTFFNSQGPLYSTASNELSTRTNIELQKRFATGAELLVGFANSLVWEFTGSDQYTGTSLIDFSLTQPLLRGAGRAVILEHLTDAERALLANVRQMERFQCGFYTQIIAGKNPGTGPTGGSITVGSLSPGNNGGASGGIMSLMQQKIEIRNQVQNVVALQDTLEQLIAFFEAGQINFFQVEQNRLNLYTAQINLLDLKNSYQNRLDDYKMTMGLPPSLDVEVHDPLLDRFNLIDPSLTQVTGEVTELVARIRDPGSEDSLEKLLPQIPILVEACRRQVTDVGSDLERLNQILPHRVKNLERLSKQPEFQGSDVDPAIVDPKLFVKRVEEAHLKYDTLSGELNKTFTQLEIYEGILENLPVKKTERDALRKRLKNDVGRLSAQLLELSLLQAVSRLETITLKPVSLEAPVAYNIAKINRLDWKNARAALVDEWRQIEVEANKLENNLRLVFDGDLGTRRQNPWQFRGTTGHLRVGMQFDSPVPKLEERNIYRRTLIAYQRTRRRYYEFEDEVDQVLRRNLRDLRLAQINFEQRRAAVYVAARQVDLKQLDLLYNPSELGATTARDVVDALDDLLREQNQFLTVWVDYEIQLMNLAFNLGIMELDPNGMWVEETFPEILKIAAQEASDASGLPPDPFCPDPCLLPETIPTPNDATSEEPELIPAPKDATPKEKFDPPIPVPGEAAETKKKSTSLPELISLPKRIAWKSKRGL